VTRRAGVVVIGVAFAPARARVVGRRRLAAAVRVVHGRRRRSRSWRRRRRRPGCNRRRRRSLGWSRRRSCHGRLTRRSACGRGLPGRRLRSSRRRLVRGSWSGGNERGGALWGDTQVGLHRECGATRRRMRADASRRDCHRGRNRHGGRRHRRSERLFGHHGRRSRWLQGHAPEVAGGHRCATEGNDTQ
jgi:hypothetical protein